MQDSLHRDRSQLVYTTCEPPDSITIMLLHACNCKEARLVYSAVAACHLVPSCDIDGYNIIRESGMRWDRAAPVPIDALNKKCTPHIGGERGHSIPVL